MKVKLKSDFIDFYDHWFDNEGIIFERMTKNELSRSQMFSIFDQYHIATPKHGKVKDLILELSPYDWVVVYLDEYEHQGKGKIFGNINYAASNYPSYYASQYIPSQATSIRELWLGDYHFVLQYSSDDTWRSNVGNVEICIKANNPLMQNKRVFDYPIYAIDYIAYPNVITGDIDYLAIDLNTSPMVRGTGIENIVSAIEIANSIKKYIKKG